jgi:hypothetical protein
MGGIGSGDGGRVSDAEKQRRGTVDPRFTEAEQQKRQESRVITGPWLSEIPKSEFPLGDLGVKKYTELTQMLFDQNKLTLVTVMHAQVAAMQFEKISNMLKEGKHPSASDSTQLQRALAALRIAENAQKIASPGKKNKFHGSGFSNRRVQAL